MPAMTRSRRAAPLRPKSGRGRARRANRHAASRHTWSTKLGAWARAQLRSTQYDPRTRTALTIAVVAAVAAVFVLIAGAVGALDSLDRGVRDAGAAGARAMGLSVREVRVQAATGLSINEFQQAEVEAVAGVAPDAVLFSVDPVVIRDRVMTLPWVEGVVVRRLWPDSVQIVVQPRAATALWQNKGVVVMIDAKGRSLGAPQKGAATGLPLVIGPKADVAAADAFALLGPRREVAARTLALVRVDDRRWNLRLRAGGEVLLPADGLEGALDRLETLQAEHRLLDRRFARLDVRTPGALLIIPKAEADVKATEPA
jgi:cell division protein FtsQ